MISLLENQFIDYLQSQKPHLRSVDRSRLSIKTEIVSAIHFDIMDKETSIIQPIGRGSATYDNPEGKTITFIDYEHFINQLPLDLQKGIKRCDFIAYDSEHLTFFILNELSQSESVKSKLNDARQQLYTTALYLSSTPAIKVFIDQHQRKKCIFSNKQQRISTPEGVADAFHLIQSYLPEPITHNFQPIQKLGFDFIETAIVYV